MSMVEALLGAESGEEQRQAASVATGEESPPGKKQRAVLKRPAARTVAADETTDLVLAAKAKTDTGDVDSEGTILSPSARPASADPSGTASADDEPMRDRSKMNKFLDMFAASHAAIRRPWF